MAASPRSLPLRSTVSGSARGRAGAPGAMRMVATLATLGALGCAGSKPPATTVADKSAPSAAAAEAKAATPAAAAEGQAEPQPLPEGPLSKLAIEKVIQSHPGRFQPCYDAGLKKDASLRGRVMARIVIANDGYVVSSEDAGSSLPDASVTTCVLAGFKTLRFPLPTESYVTVVYPMQFEAAQDDAASVLKSGPFRGCSVAEGSIAGESGLTTQIACGGRKLIVTDMPVAANSKSAQQHLSRFEESISSAMRPKRSSPKLEGKSSWVTVVQEKGTSWGTMVVLAFGKEKTRVVECSGTPNGISRWCERQVASLAKGFSPKGLLFASESR